MLQHQKGFCTLQDKPWFSKLHECKLKYLSFDQIVQTCASIFKFSTHVGDLMNLGPKHADLCQDFSCKTSQFFRKLKLSDSWIYISLTWLDTSRQISDFSSLLYYHLVIISPKRFLRFMCVCAHEHAEKQMSTHLPHMMFLRSFPVQKQEE